MLILREELVCLIILVYLAFVSRSYRMGTDGKQFNRLMTFAVLHVAMDIFTVYTVNHTDSVIPAVNYAAHIIFYLAAIFFAREILLYAISLFYAREMKKWRLVSLVPIGIYVLCLPLLKVEYVQGRGTFYSDGPAVYVGFAVGFLYFAAALLLIIRNWKRLNKQVKYNLVPMLLILIVAEVAQMLVKELLFTGGAVTVITVGFFFSLENPHLVLERKNLIDAMTGVKNRNSYERDIQEYAREFARYPDRKFVFVFADMNNLKQVNGLYGHQDGDEYISFIAVALLNSLKGAEHIYRMGGDEFLAIYRDVEEETLLQEIEKVHLACRKATEDGRYTRELAIGYAVSGPEYKTLQDVLRVADYMMYRNKAELKRENVGEIKSDSGTRLNLTGLADRLFDALCLTGEGFYPFLMNLETGVTRVSPKLRDAFGLESEFFADFGATWAACLEPEDREPFRQAWQQVVGGGRQEFAYEARTRKPEGAVAQVSCRGHVYHGQDGEPDMFTGYLMIHDTQEGA